MNNKSYSVTETVYRREDQIIGIVYDFEEVDESLELKAVTRDEHDPHEFRRYFRATINRDDYEYLNRTCISNADEIPFETFIRILRPIMAGTYAGNELQEIFNLLDKDGTGKISIEDISDFLPIDYSDAAKQRLLKYVGKSDTINDDKLTFEEFNGMILRGIGRDIVCGYLSTVPSNR